MADESEGQDRDGVRRLKSQTKGQKVTGRGHNYKPVSYTNTAVDVTRPHAVDTTWCSAEHVAVNQERNKHIAGGSVKISPES